LSSQIQLRKEKVKVFITIYKLKEKRREEKRGPGWGK